MSQPGRKMSLSQATMLVAGNMIGTGVFLLPVNLAQVGGIAIFGWVDRHGRRRGAGPRVREARPARSAAGRPVCLRARLPGPYAGFQTNYVYWFGNWIGNIAIAVAAIGLSLRTGSRHQRPAVEP